MNGKAGSRSGCVPVDRAMGGSSASTGRGRHTPGMNENALRQLTQPTEAGGPRLAPTSQGAVEAGDQEGAAGCRRGTRSHGPGRSGREEHPEATLRWTLRKNAFV